MTSLPDGWRLVRLGDVAETALGKMLDAARPKGTSSVPYLRNLNVQWGRIDTDDVREVALNANEQERFQLEPGDLLVCEGGEIGRAAIWRGGSGYMAYQKALHRIRSKGDVDLTYLRYLLEYFANNGELASRATGSTILHLPQQKLRELPIPLPQLDEQLRIVEGLEAYESRLDAAAALVRNSRRRLDSLQASALSCASVGELVALAEVASIQGGIQKQPKRAPRAHAYPFLRVANVARYGLDLESVHQIELFAGELERLRLQKGDLLVVEGNGSASQIGRAALWDGSIDDCVHQNHLIRVRASHRLLPEYLEVVWNSPENRRRLTGLASSSSGLYTLSVSKLSSLRIPVPPIEGQRAAISQVSEIRDAARRLDVAATLAMARGHGLRQALLLSAFTGGFSDRHVNQATAKDLIGV